MMTAAGTTAGAEAEAETTPRTGNRLPKRPFSQVSLKLFAAEKSLEVGLAQKVNVSQLLLWALPASTASSIVTEATAIPNVTSQNRSSAASASIASPTEPVTAPVLVVVPNLVADFLDHVPGPLSTGFDLGRDPSLEVVIGPDLVAVPSPVVVPESRNWSELEPWPPLERPYTTVCVASHAVV